MGLSMNSTVDSLLSESLLITNGDAVLNKGRLRLTDVSDPYTNPNDQKGTAFLQVDVGQAESWEAFFTFQVSDSGGITDKFQDVGVLNGADGLVFMLQSNGAHALGASGEGLGYLGIDNSFAVEFDTWANPNRLDPNSNHLGININGSVRSIKTQSLPGAVFENISETPVNAWVQYDGGERELSVYVSADEGDDYPSRPEDPSLTIDFDDPDGDGDESDRIDLDSSFGQGSNWIGFGAATGGAYATHEILDFEFNKSSLSVTKDFVIEGSDNQLLPFNTIALGQNRLLRFEVENSSDHAVTFDLADNIVGSGLAFNSGTLETSDPDITSVHINKFDSDELELTATLAGNSTGTFFVEVQALLPDEPIVEVPIAALTGIASEIESYGGRVLDGSFLLYESLITDRIDTDNDHQVDQIVLEAEQYTNTVSVTESETGITVTDEETAQLAFGAVDVANVGDFFIVDGGIGTGSTIWGPWGGNGVNTSEAGTLPGVQMFLQFTEDPDFNLLEDQGAVAFFQQFSDGIAQLEDGSLRVVGDETVPDIAETIDLVFGELANITAVSADGKLDGLSGPVLVDTSISSVLTWKGNDEDGISTLIFNNWENGDKVTIKEPRHHKGRHKGYKDYSSKKSRTTFSPFADLIASSNNAEETLKVKVDLSKSKKRSAKDFFDASANKFSSNIDVTVKTGNGKDKVTDFGLSVGERLNTGRGNDTLILFSGVNTYTGAGKDKVYVPVDFLLNPPDSVASTGEELASTVKDFSKRQDKILLQTTEFTIDDFVYSHNAGDLEIRLGSDTSDPGKLILTLEHTRVRNRHTFERIVSVTPDLPFHTALDV
ncbi:hypothetical protein D0962_19295 [Leptolyngbyaceae cyanobacterium CCMR0082]|uniref:Legume lectin domain-containing protein n=2 Tax=Adonisia TaxID=2950183 RepID=A0A6M0S8V1_9CYAN|nr:hypothetical protein [Adonisia turfae CCMR0082]